MNQSKTKEKDQKKNIEILETKEVESDEENFKAFPLADLKFTSKILECLHRSIKYKQIKKGINETVKMLKKDQVECVIMAKDADPIELLAHIPLICDEKSVPYCFVPESASLGRACGISRPVIACCISISDSSGMQNDIDMLKDNIEMLFYS